MIVVLSADLLEAVGGPDALAAADASQNNAPLFLKLDSQGNVQWQRQLGPSGQIQALLNDVRQSADGGYVVTGELQTPSASGFPNQSVLAVKLDSGGGVLWERAFNSFASRGIPNASENALSLIQSSDGGYVIAGKLGRRHGTEPVLFGRAPAQARRGRQHSLAERLQRRAVLF